MFFIKIQVQFAYYQYKTISQKHQTTNCSEIMMNQNEVCQIVACVAKCRWDGRGFTLVVRQHPILYSTVHRLIANKVFGFDYSILPGK